MIINSEEREDATEEHSGKGDNLDDSQLNIGGLVEGEVDVNASGNTVRRPVKNMAHFNAQSVYNVIPILIDTDDSQVPLLDMEKLFNAAKEGNFDEIRGTDYDILNARDKYSNTFLHYAVNKNCLDVVEKLIKNGADVNVKNDIGNTPLYFAVTEGYLDIVEELIKNRANINVKNDIGNTSLHVAARCGCLDVVENLIENGADVNARNRDGDTPLHVAARCGCLDVVENLIENGADVNARNRDGDTPLHVAARCGYLDVVRELIRNGAYFDVKNTSGQTPLDVSKDNNNPEVSKFLSGIKNLFDAVKEGKFCNIKGLAVNARNRGGDTPLHVTAKCGYLDVVENLIENGADVNARNRDGDTPLHVAARCGYLDVVRELIRNGAYFDVKNTSGQTPLDVSKDNNNPEVSKFLSGIKNLFDAVKEGKFCNIKGLAVNARNSDGNTPLHIAARNDCLDIVKKLVRNRAYFDVKNTSGQTPLDVSKDNNNPEVSKFLSGIKNLFDAAKKGKLHDVKGLSANARNRDGDTPLLLAVMNGDLDAIEKYRKKSYKNANKETLLHFVARKGYLRAVENLIKNGADVNARNRGGDTPLHVAARCGCLDVVENLIENGAYFDVKNTSGQTPLDVSKDNNNPEVSKFLSGIKNLFDAVKEGNCYNIKGLAVNARNRGGDTPLHVAARCGCLDVVENLIENGAYFDVKNTSGQTPLDVSKDNNNPEVSKFLSGIKNLFDAVKEGNCYNIKGLAVNARNSDGDTLLHIAARNDYLDIVKELIKNGADISIENNRGYTIFYTRQIRVDCLLIEACTGGMNASISRSYRDDIFSIVANYECVEDEYSYVIKDFLNKVDLNIRNDNGDTLLHSAVRDCSSKRVDILMQAGVDKDIENDFGETPLELVKKMQSQNLNQYKSNSLAKIKELLKTKYEKEIELFDRQQEACLAEKVSTCLSEIGVTKLGSNLNR